MRTHWWKYLIVATATALAAFLTWRALPPAEEVAVAEATVRTPYDLSSSSVVGLYIENFAVALRGVATTAVVTEAVDGVTDSQWRENARVDREGSSAAMRLRLEHSDPDVAQAALDLGMRTVLGQINDVVLDRPRDLLAIAQADMDEARAAVDNFFAETGQLNPGGAYSNNISEIRQLDRQIREATLLRFSPAYIEGLQAARDALAQELPTLASQSQQFDVLRSRLEHARGTLYSAEERLTVAELDYAANRSPDALVLQPVTITMRPLTMVQLQQVLIAGAVAFAISLVLVLLLGPLLSLNPPRRRGQQPAWRHGAADGDGRAGATAVGAEGDADGHRTAASGPRFGIDHPHLVEVE